MPDGLYTTWGWRPLPFCEAENAATPRRQRVTLIWGAICFSIAAAGVVISGLLRRDKRTDGR